MTVKEAIESYHKMRYPRNAAEMKTAAALLGLKLAKPDCDGLTLADHIDIWWQARVEARNGRGGVEG